MFDERSMYPCSVRAKELFTFNLQTFLSQMMMMIIIIIIMIIIIIIIKMIITQKNKMVFTVFFTHQC
jgi:hypothetical protein